MLQQSLPPPEGDEELELVGRLDKASDGLLLATTDTALRARILATHGASAYGSSLVKHYRVRTNFPLSEEQLDLLRSGVEIGTAQRRRGGKTVKRPTLPCEVERDSAGASGKVLHIWLREGRNRQLRKMIGSLGHRVATLRRLAIGPISLDRLAAPGAVAELTDEEASALKAALPHDHMTMGVANGSQAARAFPWRQRLCDERDGGGNAV